MSLNDNENMSTFQVSQCIYSKMPLMNIQCFPTSLLKLPSLCLASLNMGMFEFSAEISPKLLNQWLSSKTVVCRSVATLVMTSAFSSPGAEQSGR